ncbi:MAG TPA: DUF2892 domain-containing protein [Burkholderiales bacterium]
MKANVGGIDKILRIVAGLALIALAIAGIGLPWTWIGVVPLLTGVVGFCPFYPLLGLSTCPIKDAA